jgi:hypothetical protein
VAALAVSDHNETLLYSVTLRGTNGEKSVRLSLDSGDFSDTIRVINGKRGVN